jgi:hypothetical protein
MKSPNFILGILAGAVAIAATAWKLFPETPLDPFTGSATTQSLSTENEKQSGSASFLAKFNSEDTGKPEFTKIADRSLTGKTTRDGTNRPTAAPKASSRPNPVKERLQASARESFLNAPLPTPAVFIALDPSVSGIPADHEPAVQAMAVDASNIIKSYEAAVAEIEANSALSPASKELALLDEKHKAFDGIKYADYQFRAKYGARAWMAHHIAAHREFNPEK